MKRLLIDGDGCAYLSKIRAFVKEKGYEFYIYLDDAHPLKDVDEHIIYVDQGKDHVDMALLKDVQSKDLVITQDYGLAALVLSKQALAINTRGEPYTQDHIDALLMQRYISMQQRKKNRAPTMKKSTKKDEERLLKAILDYFETKRAD